MMRATSADPESDAECTTATSSQAARASAQTGGARP